MSETKRVCIYNPGTESSLIEPFKRIVTLNVLGEMTTREELKHRVLNNAIDLLACSTSRWKYILRFPHSGLSKCLQVDTPRNKARSLMGQRSEYNAFYNVLLIPIWNNDTERLRYRFIKSLWFIPLRWDASSRSMIEIFDQTLNELKRLEPVSECNRLWRYLFI